MTLNIALPEIDTQELGKSERDIRLDVAIFCYIAWQMSPGRCADYAGIPKVVFLDELGRRNIPLHYDVTALTQDYTNWISYLSTNDNRQRYNLS